MKLKLNYMGKGSIQFSKISWKQIDLISFYTDMIIYTVANSRLFKTEKFAKNLICYMDSHVYVIFVLYSS